MTFLSAYMYRQISNVPTKLWKSIIGGGGAIVPSPSGYASGRGPSVTWEKAGWKFEKSSFWDGGGTNSLTGDAAHVFEM